MIVKICGVTTADDAHAAVDAGANAIGFNFYAASPRYIDPEKAAAIMEALPAGVLKVGIFVDHVLPVEGLDVAQLYGTARWSGRFWRAVRAGEGFQADAVADEGEDALVVDAPHPALHGGTGQTFDWRLARSARRRIVLAGGLDETNVREAIETARPWGVDACSRLERAPGLKDHRRVRAFVQAALAAAPATI
ncbi:MAG: phosphoribosylanthranilate isomerase [bacterium]|jgi:phosphoribosylanthranilate isomerase